jgi:GT2 family glycosyltransferase
VSTFEKIIVLLLGKRLLRSWLTWRYKTELWIFLQSNRKITFEAVTTPDVSVIIPIFNSAHHTLRSLRSLLADRSVSLEVIIFDNASTDHTTELLQRCENVVVIRSVENLGFVSAVNAASKRAQGRFLLLLNNDVTILSGQIRHATDVFDSESNVGAVGARISFATGHLQEAGCIIFRDGMTNGYMRDKATEHPSAMYRRDVDFCSGAFLLVESRQFSKMGGLDEIFAPAYYEETDLCMRLRSQGLRVIYTPSILIEHFEFGSQPSGAAFEAISKRLPIFLERWQSTLISENFTERGGSYDTASRRLILRPRLLLVLDSSAIDQIPNSIRQAMQSAANGKYHVCLFVIGLRHVSWAQFHAIHGEKIELILNSGEGDLFKLMEKRKNYFDLVAAIGPQSSSWLEKSRKSDPSSLYRVTSSAGSDSAELEQMLDGFLTQHAIVDRK